MPPLSLPVVDRQSLDNSILNTLGRCPRLAFYNYRLNRAPLAKSYPILFGVAYHRFREVLEILYKKTVLEQGKPLDEVQSAIFELAFGTATKDWQDPPLEHKKSYLDLTRFSETCEAAFANWLEEKRTGIYTVLQTETAFEVELPSGRYFTGRIDQVLEWNGRLWVRDFKTTGRKEDFRKKYNPDHQFTGYVYAAQKLSGRPVEGVIIDIVYNIKTKGPEFYPTLATRTSGDIEHWMEWFDDQAGEWERRSESGLWVMRTSACTDFGGCFFREACDSGDWNTIQDWLEQNTVESHWDPASPDDEVGLPE